MSGDILAPIGAGELIDKITILKIKNERIDDSARLANVRIELDALEETRRAAGLVGEAITALEAELLEINSELWVIEDDIRECEARGDFGETFISLARSVYITNDKRAAVKRRINDAAGSRIVEEKSYASIEPGGGAQANV